MDITNTEGALMLVTALAIVIGIFGTVIPFVPGLILSWGGVLLWTLFTDRGSGKWIVLAVATAFALLGTLLKWLLPGQRMKREGVGTLTLLAGAAVGIVGFFVVPVVGVFLGFVLGVFLAELVRLRNAREAWPSTWQAVKAVGLSMLVEIFFGLCILATWIGGLVFVPSPAG